MEENKNKGEFRERENGGENGPAGFEIEKYFESAFRLIAAGMERIEGAGGGFKRIMARKFFWEERITKNVHAGRLAKAAKFLNREVPAEATAVFLTGRIKRKTRSAAKAAAARARKAKWRLKVLSWRMKRAYRYSVKSVRAIPKKIKRGAKTVEVFFENKIIGTIEELAGKIKAKGRTMKENYFRVIAGIKSEGEKFSRSLADQEEKIESTVRKFITRVKQGDEAIRDKITCAVMAVGESVAGGSKKITDKIQRGDEAIREGVKNRINNIVLRMGAVAKAVREQIANRGKNMAGGFKRRGELIRKKTKTALNYFRAGIIRNARSAKTFIFETARNIQSFARISFHTALAGMAKFSAWIIPASKWTAGKIKIFAKEAKTIFVRVWASLKQSARKSRLSVLELAENIAVLYQAFAISLQNFSFRKPEREADVQNVADAGETAAEAQPEEILTLEEPPVGELIPLSEIAGESEYKKGYLVFEARLGKLKARKLDGVWKTTRKWLDEFTREARERKDEVRRELSRKMGGAMSLQLQPVPVRRTNLGIAMAFLLLIFFIGAANANFEALGILEGRAIGKAVALYNGYIEGVSRGAEKISEGLSFAVYDLKVGSGKIRQKTREIASLQKLKQFKEKTGLNLVGDKEKQKQLAESETEGIVAGESSYGGSPAGGETGGRTDISQPPPSLNQQFVNGNQSLDASLSDSRGAGREIAAIGNSFVTAGIGEHAIRRWNLHANAVNSRKIVDYSVEARDLSNNAVNSRIIENRSVHSRDLAKNIEITGSFSTLGPLTIGSHTTTHDLGTEGDLLVSNALEVDGPAYFDSTLYVKDSTSLSTLTSTTLATNTANISNILSNSDLAISGKLPDADTFSVYDFTQVTINPSGLTTIGVATPIQMDTDTKKENSLLVENNLEVQGIIYGTVSGAFAPSGDVDMNNHILTNIGAAGTDFSATGGLTLADQLVLGANTIADGNLTGDWSFNGGALTNVASIDTINISSTALTFTGTAPTISVSTAATNINFEAGTTGEINIGSVSSGNVNIAAQGTGNILLAGGSGSTGCTITNASGDLACSGNITGSSSGIVGFWTRTGTNLSPATAGDDIYLPANSLLGVGYDPATFLAGTVAAFSGSVGIGTTSPLALLSIGPTSQFQVSSAGYITAPKIEITNSSGLKTFIANSDTTSYNASVETLGTFNNPSGGIGKYQNLLYASEQFDSAMWVPTTTTVTANNVVAPDGQTTADTLTGADASSEIRQTVSSSDLGWFNFSIWLKVPSGTQNISLLFGYNGATGSGSSSNVVTVTNQWQRFSFLSGTWSVPYAVYAGVNYGTNVVYAWGAQLEYTGASPLPSGAYVRTTTTNASVASSGLVSNRDIIANGNIGAGVLSPIAPLDVYGAINGSVIPAPGPPVAGAATAGGSVNTGQHSWKVTFVNAYGETTPGGKSNVKTISGGNKTVPLTAISIGPAGTTARKIYRTVSGDTGNWKLLTTISDNTTTTYTDTTADASLGADAPTTNTTGNLPISIAGATKVQIDSSGNVGIGTTLPRQIFQVNASGSSAFVVNSSGNVGIGITSPLAKLHIQQAATATGALKGIVYTGAVNTNQTASTEIPSLTLTTAGRQWATGALATQREVLITAPTYSFVGASTITDAATLAIAGAPIKSTNATITNTHALLIQAGAVSTATNSYGLTVNAQTGASYNYAAAFLGGNVGIGTTSPGEKLEVNGNISLINDGSAKTLGINNTGVGGAGSSLTISAGPGNVMSGTGGNLYLKSGDSGAAPPSSVFVFPGNVDGSGNVILAHTGSVARGNVGIGTTLPGNKLSVSGGVGIGTTAPGSLYLSTAAPDGGLIVEGRVGIGITVPDYKLDIDAGSGKGLHVKSTSATALETLYCESSGANGCGGNQAWYSSSDLRLKTDVATIDDALGKVLQLRGVNFRWRSSLEPDMGFIAQEVKDVVPEIVGRDASGYYGMRTSQLTAILVEAVKQQQSLITQNSQRVTQLDLNISQVSQSTAELQTAVNEKLNIISNSLTSLNSRISQTESQTGELETRLSAAEAGLQEAENNLATFQTAANDTLAAMLETETMLTRRILDHEDRLKALEDKMAALSVSGGEVPANVITTDKDGNAVLAGVFKAKKIEAGEGKFADGIVAGEIDAKKITLGKDASGTETLKAGETKTKIQTSQVSADSKIYVTPLGKLSGRSLYVDMSEIKEGESFTVQLDGETLSKDIEFNWLVVN